MTPKTEAGQRLLNAIDDDWPLFDTEERRYARRIRTVEREAGAEAIAAYRHGLVRKVRGLAFEFDDETPRRFMVERAAILALLGDPL